MLKVPVPVDGSNNALRAVRHTIGEYQRHHEPEVHLLNVQPRLSRYVTRFYVAKITTPGNKSTLPPRWPAPKPCSRTPACRIRRTPLLATVPMRFAAQQRG